MVVAAHLIAQTRQVREHARIVQVATRAISPRVVLTSTNVLLTMVDAMLNRLASIPTDRSRAAIAPLDTMELGTPFACHANLELADHPVAFASIVPQVNLETKRG